MKGIGWDIVTEKEDSSLFVVFEIFFLLSEGILASNEILLPMLIF